MVSRNDNSLRSCISSFNLQNNDNDLVMNIKYCLDKLMNNNLKINYGSLFFPSININEINQLEFKISLLSNLKPININDFYGNRFVIGQDIILSKNKNNYEYLFTNVEKNINNSITKKDILDKLSRSDIDTSNKKNNNYKISSMDLYYYECLDI